MKFDLSSWAFKNIKLINFLVAVLIMGGIFAYYDMSKLEDPEIKVRQALVIGIYPGASAHQVELEVVDPLEKSIRQMNTIYSVQSYSYADMCILVVEQQSTVPADELEQQWDILRRKVAATPMPNGVRSITVKDDFGDVFGMFYAITGEGLNDRELSDYAELVKRELGRLEGVGRVDIYGRRTECINVSISHDKMANLGVSPLEVVQTLRGQNETVYSGYYEAGDERIRVSVNDKYKTPQDIAGLIIQGHEQDQVRLGDLASVTLDYDDPVRASLQYDGERALGISISAINGTDITKVGKAVQQRLSEIQATRMPAGVEFHKVFFQPERVTDSLSTFIINLIESVLLVVFVLIFTMGLRSGLIIGLELVVIVLGSILVLYTQNGTLQRVSLGAFILAMGMLVDNAIVIVDGILVDRAAGKPRLEALTSIGRQTALPLLGATLIAILAFLPIFLSPDTTGIYVRDLFIVIAVSLMLSWILALVHTPLVAGRAFYHKKREFKLLKHHRFLPKKEATPDAFVEPDSDKDAPRATQHTDDSLYNGATYRLLRRFLTFCLSHRVTVLIVLVALFIGSVLCYRFLPQAFFPDMTYDQLYMEYKLPEGYNYTRVQQDLDSIQAYLRQRPEVTHITASTGGTPSRYNLVRSIATPSLSYGELIIDFTDAKTLVKNMDEIQADLSRMFPDAYLKLKRYNLMYKKYPIEVQFSGPDPAVLHELSDTCRNIMLRSGAVRLITTDWAEPIPTLVVDYNQQNARRLGLSRTEVGTSLLAATSGLPVGSFYDGIHSQSIYVNTVSSDGQPIEDINEATVFGLMPNISGIMNKDVLESVLSGRMRQAEIVEELLRSTPLRQVGSGVHVEWEDPLVIRMNGQRAQRVQCSPELGYGTEEARSILEKELAKLKLPEGYTLSWAGEKEASDQSMKYLFKNFPLAIILMIAILIMLFKDYKIPCILFCCIPMILIGVIPAVLISGKDFGFVALVGVLGLIGMMLKNGIVLMDEIQLEISAGKEPRAALVDSSLSRLRPVMMAAATTILGMVPLLPDAMFGSMAATIMGGLFMGTVITLIILPVLYALFYDVKE
ncbi:MAG: efflux RND transporter permease subunit [Bacteroidaceae bacterium]|nr:efflux RND transporter permease subunit [Bacteroidaceae bacterium]